MKKNKKIFLRVLLAIILILFIIYFISVIYKYVVLSKINSAYENSKKIENYTYSYTNKNEDYIVYKYNNITKAIETPKYLSAKSIYWEDSSSNEKLEFAENNDEKIYFSVDYILSGLSSSSLNIDDNEKTIRFIVAMNPLIFINSCNYDNQKCYNICYYNEGKNVEKINKETGLIMYGNYNYGGEIFYKYDFNNINEKDVEKPDINLYTYINMQ